MTLTSFGENIKLCVIGATGGLGAAFVDTLLRLAEVEVVYALSRRPLHSEHRNCMVLNGDITDESSLIRCAGEIADNSLALTIVATGFLHDETHQPEKSSRTLSLEGMQQAFLINSIAPALIAKHFLPKMRRQAKASFAVLSARVGSISDNHKGGWYSYRASKAALNMLLQNFALEFRLKNPSLNILALQPGTVNTALSAPFQARVAPEKLFTPSQSANHLLQVIDTANNPGVAHFLDWQGKSIPW